MHVCASEDYQRTAPGRRTNLEWSQGKYRRNRAVEDPSSRFGCSCLLERIASLLALLLAHVLGISRVLLPVTSPTTLHKIVRARAPHAAASSTTEAEDSCASVACGRGLNDMMTCRPRGGISRAYATSKRTQGTPRSRSSKGCVVGLENCRRHPLNRQLTSGAVSHTRTQPSR